MSAERGRLFVLLFSLTIFLSASLLFLIQPLFARQLLPLPGGSPSIWNTALVFYQGVLLLGYLYAHLSLARLGPRRQIPLHLVVAALALVSLPIGLSGDERPPATGSPIPWLLGVMAVHVGLPFFVVSATSPLLQRWFSFSGHRASADPYFLYAASNLGSVVGLLSYPLLIEPRVSLALQSRGWALGYGILLALLVASGVGVWRRLRAGTPPEQEPLPEVDGERFRRPDPARRFRWVMLAFVPSSLMIGVTTYITTDIASAPLLWMIPLALYLATFIFVFSARQWVPRRVWAAALPPALVAMVIAFAAPVTKPVEALVVLGLVAFFLVGMVMHGELAADRPHPRYLTEFFAWISFGGVLGGAFAALLAPVLFTRVLEPIVTLILAAILLPTWKGTGRRVWAVDAAVPILAGVTIWVAFAQLDAFSSWYRDWSGGGLSELQRAAYLFGAAGLSAWGISWRPIGFAACLAVMVALGMPQQAVYRNTVWEKRNFFGALRVTREGAWHKLYHGTTLHGVEVRLGEGPSRPSSYYHPSGPIGQVFAEGPIEPGERIAVVGLGVGSLAAYGRPDQRWTFYEIDPDIEALARDARLFTFLRDARAPFRVVIGDARVSLSRTDARYGLIVLDAYSSDAIPLHLLTREAMELYRERLEEGGLIALHISNRHMDLEPVVARLAKSLGMVARIWLDSEISPVQAAEGKFTSEWVLLARTEADLGKLVEDPRWRALRGAERAPLWTDDYASIASVLDMPLLDALPWLRRLLGGTG